MWSLGRRRGGREQTHTPLTFSPSLFSEPERTNERVGKKSRVWVQPRASGVLLSSLSPMGGGFPLLSGGFRELTSLFHDLPGVPLCKKLDFSQRPQWNDFQHIFSRLKMKKRKLRDQWKCAHKCHSLGKASACYGFQNKTPMLPSTSEALS